MIRRERRDGGEGVERIEKESREGIEIERKETKDNGVNNLKRRIRNRHLPLLVVQLRFS